MKYILTGSLNLEKCNSVTVVEGFRAHLNGSFVMRNYSSELMIFIFGECERIFCHCVQNSYGFLCLRQTKLSGWGLMFSVRLSVRPFVRLSPNLWTWDLEKKWTNFDENWRKWSIWQGHETINLCGSGGESQGHVKLNIDLEIWWRHHSGSPWLQ